MAELWQMSGLELGAAIAAKHVSATEVLEAILERVEAVNPKVNAIVTFSAETGRKEAQAVDAAVAASIPVGFTRSGLPVGLQIVGRRFDEVTVLRASARFEEARPWADHWPTL